MPKSANPADQKKKIQKNEMFRSSLELESRYAPSAEFDAELNVDVFRPLPPLFTCIFDRNPNAQFGILPNGKFGMLQI